MCLWEWSGDLKFKDEATDLESHRWAAIGTRRGPTPSNIKHCPLSVENTVTHSTGIQCYSPKAECTSWQTGLCKVDMFERVTGRPQGEVGHPHTIFYMTFMTELYNFTPCPIPLHPPFKKKICWYIESLSLTLCFFLCRGPDTRWFIPTHLPSLGPRCLIYRTGPSCKSLPRWPAMSGQHLSLSFVQLQHKWLKNKALLRCSCTHPHAQSDLSSGIPRASWWRKQVIARATEPPSSTCQEKTTLGRWTVAV